MTPEQRAAAADLTTKYDENKDEGLSPKELDKFSEADKALAAEVGLDEYLHLKAELQAVLEKKQSRQVAEAELERKAREAEEARAQLELRRREEMQAEEDALEKGKIEMKRLEEEINSLNQAEEARKTTVEKETREREERVQKEMDNYNTLIRTKESQRLEVEGEAKEYEEALTKLKGDDAARRNRQGEEERRLQEARQRADKEYKEHLQKYEETLSTARGAIKQLTTGEEKLYKEYTNKRAEVVGEENERNRRLAKEEARFQKDLATKQAAREKTERDVKVLEGELKEIHEKETLRRRRDASEARCKLEADAEARDLEHLQAEQDAKRVTIEKRVATTPDVEPSLPKPGAEPPAEKSGTKSEFKPLGPATVAGVKKPDDELPPTEAVHKLVPKPIGEDAPKPKSDLPPIPVSKTKPADLMPVIAKPLTGADEPERQVLEDKLRRMADDRVAKAKAGEEPGGLPPLPKAKVAGSPLSNLPPLPGDKPGPPKDLPSLPKKPDLPPLPGDKPTGSDKPPLPPLPKDKPLPPKDLPPLPKKPDLPPLPGDKPTGSDKPPLPPLPKDKPVPPKDLPPLSGAEPEAKTNLPPLPSASGPPKDLPPMPKASDISKPLPPLPGKSDDKPDLPPLPKLDTPPLPPLTKADVPPLPPLPKAGAVGGPPPLPEGSLEDEAHAQTQAEEKKQAD